MFLQGFRNRKILTSILAALLVLTPVSSWANDSESLAGELIVKFNYNNKSEANRLRGRGLSSKYNKFVKEFFQKANLSKANKTAGKRFEPVHDSLVSRSEALNENETEISKHFQTSSAKISKDLGLLRTLRIKVSADQDLEALSKKILKKAKRFSNYNLVDVRPNYLLKSDFTPNDTYFADGSQWAVDVLNLRSAWEVNKGSENVVIAVIDSGIDYNHKDLKDKIWNNQKENPINGLDDDGNGYVDDYFGYDFVAEAGTSCTDKDCGQRDFDVMDNQGHGTSVAGAAAASTDNAFGIAGACPNCKLMPLRAGYQAEGQTHFSASDVEAAIVYAVNNGADIINMSFSTSIGRALDKSVINYARAADVVLVASAGNHASDVARYPAAYEGVIAVQSSNQRGELSEFSAYGNWVDVSAPGEGIRTTYLGQGFATVSGTSMAAPYISGIAALLKSANPNLNAEQILALMKGHSNQQAGKLADASSSIIDAPHIGGTYAAFPVRPTMTPNRPVTERASTKQISVPPAPTTRPFITYTPTPIPPTVPTPLFTPILTRTVTPRPGTKTPVPAPTGIPPFPGATSTPYVDPTFNPGNPGQPTQPPSGPTAKPTKTPKPNKKIKFFKLIVKNSSGAPIKNASITFIYVGGKASAKTDKKGYAEKSFRTGTTVAASIKARGYTDTSTDAYKLSKDVEVEVTM